MTQKIIIAENNYISIGDWIEENKVKRLFLVHDSSLPFLSIKTYFDALCKKMDIIQYDDFQPNPLYESVVKGVKSYHDNQCDAILAVGGGSAIDVAKCIKLFSNMNNKTIYLNQSIIPNEIPFFAVPTTAGTGSEATQYAVIYYHGIKQSICDESCIPGTVLLDSSTLQTLPVYQKKATMLDALCHAVESYWSVNSTDVSKEYSKNAIKLILSNMDAYLANDHQANLNMLIAANTAGKAINITQTTAGHAMCYKITSLFGIAHGHAAALCNRKLFSWMIKHTDKCIDNRGEKYLKAIFQQIAEAMGTESPEKAALKFESIFQSLELDIPKPKNEDYDLLKTSVNPVRLKNHPIVLDTETIDKLYHQIFADS